MTDTLTLAVAGGRKTQSIIDACAKAPAGRRILVLTYTQRNQAELTRRLALKRPLAASVEVQGWFSFLLGHCVRPYLPKVFPSRRLHGLNFEGDPGRYVVGQDRFLDKEGRAYKSHLAQLAVMANDDSGGAAIDRLSRIYAEIWIDEVQDLNGYDLEVLSALMASSADLHMVGDIRQAILLTNAQDMKSRQYKGVKIKNWFDEQVTRRRLVVVQAATTWRCNQEIATLADSMFDASWGFAPTVSVNNAEMAHSGIFAISASDVAAYVQEHGPLCLRHSKASWTNIDLPFMNIGVAKGMEADHVLVALTEPMHLFFKSGAMLGTPAACSLYVAITRARHSVVLLSKKPGELSFPIWRPTWPDAEVVAGIGTVAPQLLTDAP